MKKHLSIMVLLLLLPSVIASSPPFPFESKGYSDSVLIIGKESTIKYEIIPTRDWITTMKDYEVKDIRFYELNCVEVPRPRCTELLDNFVVINHTLKISDDKVLVEVIVKPTIVGTHRLHMETIFSGPSSPGTLLSIPAIVEVGEEIIVDEIIDAQEEVVVVDGEVINDSDDDINQSGQVVSETVEQKSFFTKLVGWFRNTFSFGN